MKHVFGLLMLLALCSGIGAVDFRVAGGIDVVGETVAVNEALIFGNANTIGATLSAQATTKVKDFTYGLGVDYQSARDTKRLPDGWSSSMGERSFIPVYGILSYNIPSTGKLSHALITQLGYNFAQVDFSEDDEDDRYSVKNGLFYGMGVGINYENLSLQVLYRVNCMKMTREELNNNVWEKDGEWDYINRQCNISIGYRFGKH